VYRGCIFVRCVFCGDICGGLDMSEYLCQLPRVHGLVRENFHTVTMPDGNVFNLCVRGSGFYSIGLVV